jgi:hypothetical protein
VQALEERLEALDSDIGEITEQNTDHENLGAHPAQAVETFWLRETIEELKEDIRILKGER